MAGGVVEQKPIGIPIGIDGTFSNTEFVDGKIQLKVASSNPLEYVPVGLWTSKVTDIGDNFKEYGKIIATSTSESGSGVTISTRSSSDGKSFSAWQKTETDGTILSPKNRYLQIRLELSAGYTVSKIEFANEDIINDNRFITEADYQLEEIAVPALTSDAPTVFGFPFAETNYGASWTPFRAFDRLPAHYTSGATNVTGFLGYKFATPVIIHRYELTSADITNQAPALKDWVIEASNNTTTGIDGTWEIINTQTNQTGWTQKQTRKFNMANTKAYLSYRIRWTANNGNPSSSIGELTLMKAPVKNIQLKREYKNKMDKEAWAGTGSLHKHSIVRSEWLRIDRLNITDADSNMSETTTAIPAMTSNTAPSGVASASSVFDNDSRYVAWKAFNGATSGTGAAWISQTVANEWIAYEFPTEELINKYAIAPNALLNGSQPKSFRFEAQKADNTWVTLDTRANIATGWAADQFQEFKFKNNVKYKKYRLFVVANNGFANYMSVAELRMYRKIQEG